MANVVSSVPLNYASDVVRNVFISVTFDTALDRDTINGNTCILFKEDDQSIIDGAVDYLPATKKIIFQLRAVLSADTDYSFLIMGGESGVKQLVDNQPFNSSSFILNFTTGKTIDVSIPLAGPVGYEAAVGGWFLGSDGIYQWIWGTSGEAVSHIVTTAGQIGPSGVIAPHPAGGEIYITKPLPPATFAVTDTSLANNSTDVDAGDDSEQISFTFNHIPDDDWKFSASGITIVANDVLGKEVGSLTHTFNFSDYNLLISGELEYNANYSITLDKDFHPDPDYFLSGYSVYDYTLGSDYSLSFRTEYKPFYSTVYLVRQIGSVISHVSDYTIEKLILENSKYIYDVSDPQISLVSPSDAAKRYVLCKTRWELLNQVLWEGGDVSGRSLGSFSVRYGRRLDRMMKRKLDDLEKCIDASLRSVVDSDSIDYVIKSEYSERRPVHDDSWSRLNGQTGFEEE